MADGNGFCVWLVEMNSRRLVFSNPDKAACVAYVNGLPAPPRGDALHILTRAGQQPACGGHRNILWDQS